MSSTGVGTLVFIKFKVIPAIYQAGLENFMLRTADKVNVGVSFIFFFSPGLDTCPLCLMYRYQLR